MEGLGENPRKDLPVNSALRQIQEGREKREKWEADHPELKKLTRGEVEKRWREFCGVPVFVCQSLGGGEPREASCIKCRDVGWIHQKGQGGDMETAFGPLVPCPYCNVQQERKAQIALKYSGIPEAYHQVNFDVFKHVVGAEEAADAAWYLATGQLTTPILWIHGGHGNGKTHMAYAAGLHVAKQGKRVRFVVMAEFSHKVRLAVQANTGADSLWEDLRDAEFLILDELGAEMYGEYWESALESLLNYRYAHQLRTIVTSNAPPERFPPAIKSRMSDKSVVRVIKNTAPDYRPKKK